MKNKKGTKAQKFIANVEKQVQGGGNPEMKEKEEAAKRELEMKSLFKAVPTQKVEAGVDPKSILCAFFKQNLCKKGDKCKFSHDPAVEMKAMKRNVYEQEAEVEELTDESLADMVSKKHAGNTDTDIICKNFLEALENNKYGWFWECPTWFRKSTLETLTPTSSARTSWKRLRTINMVGSGNAQMEVKTASTDMLCPLAMFLRRIRSGWRRRRRRSPLRS